MTSEIPSCDALTKASENIAITIVDVMFNLYSIVNPSQSNGKSADDILGKVCNMAN